MIRFLSEDGRSADERGTTRAPYNQGPTPGAQAAPHPGEADGSNRKVDLFPGNCNYLKLLNGLRDQVAADEIHVWDYRADGADLIDARKRLGIASRKYSRESLAVLLANRFFGVRTMPSTAIGAWLDETDAAVPRTNADWMAFSGPERELADAIRDALASPAGFVDGRAGWSHWAGVHWGVWIDAATFIDVAIWEAPTTVSHTRAETDCPDAPAVGSRRYDFQPVRWYSYDAKGRSTYKHRGWNQSHSELPYLWGWDPKDLGDQKGTRGVHVGYPFALPGFAFIVWVCFTEIFLECVATSAVRSGRLRYSAEAGAIWNVDGRAKSSTREHSGRGQWLIRERRR